jgi:putative hydrolase of the HAD superfamily
VKAVLFDMGNTLVAYWPRREFPEVLARAVGEVQAYLQQQDRLHIPEDVVRQRVQAEQGESADCRVRPLEGRLARIFDLADEPGAQMEVVCCRFMQPMFDRGRLYADTMPTLALLRAKGFKTAIVSNSPWGSPAGLWREEMARLGLAGRVDAIAFCGDVGWRKPARPIFDRVLARLGVQPEECLFVGDDPRWDLAGPRALGMQAVLIDRAGEVQAAGETPVRSLGELWAWLGQKGGDSRIAYALRHATGADRDGLYELHKATMRAYVERTWGWDENLQQQYFHQRFDPRQRRVIVVDGQDAGMMEVERSAEGLILSNIQIAPAYQGYGLGTAVIRDLLAEAQQGGLPVRLQVLRVNPARRLYERLGFIVVQETSTHFKMQWTP